MLGVGLLVPTLEAYQRSFSNHLNWLNGKDIRLHITQSEQRSAIAAANWLRHNSPPTSGLLDSEGTPEYSVLAPWGIGHIIEFEAGRPTVADNFGDDLGPENFALARRYYVSAERQAIKILEQLGVRYVFAEKQPDYLNGKPPWKSVAHAMYMLDGSQFAFNPDTPKKGATPALRRHRLIYESGRLAFHPTASPPYKIFEFVKGARFSGKTTPGGKVQIELRLHTNTLRDVLYKVTVTAKDNGRYATLLPYANRGYSHAVRVDPHYTARCEFEEATFVIDESDVIDGNTVAGPDLCLDESM
jgi:asparagine N-glycosylation enzyme membrane subunit Stt3